MKNFLGGLATFVVALIATSTAFFAVALGYSMVVCNEGALGWAIMVFIVEFFAFPPLLGLYAVLVMLAATLFRPTLARFGGARLMLWALVAAVALTAAGAAVTKIFGIEGRCSFGF